MMILKEIYNYFNYEYSCYVCNNFGNSVESRSKTGTFLAINHFSAAKKALNEMKKIAKENAHYKANSTSVTLGVLLSNEGFLEAEQIFKKIKDDNLIIEKNQIKVIYQRSDEKYLSSRNLEKRT